MKHICLTNCLCMLPREYEGNFPKGDRAHNMNQDESAGRGITSSDSGVLYTVLSNPSLHYIRRLSGNPAHFLPRWYHPRELLLTQGFAVTCELGNPKGKPFRTCSFAPGGLRKMSDRNRPSMTAQAGNAQSMVCVVTMWI